MTNLEVFKQSTSSEIFIGKKTFYIIVSNSFYELLQKIIWLQKHLAPKTIESFRHILFFVLTVYGVQF